MRKTTKFLMAILATALFQPPANAGFLEYGNENLLNTGSYASDPKAGATLQGLAANVVTFATNSYGHGYPFGPSAGDYAGTDQIYVGRTQTAAHDGYSVSAGRINGPQVITLDYSSLLGGQPVGTLTLGIAADDFQFRAFSQPFTASINGVVNTALTNTLNALDETGPVVRFLTIGINTATLSSSNILTLSIDEGGDGGDGWAIDFLTIGVTAPAVPEPSSIVLCSLGILGGVGYTLRAAKSR